MPQLDTGFGTELSELYSLEVLGAELSVLSVVQPYLLTSLQVHARQQVDLLLPYFKTELPPRLPEHQVVPGIGAAHAGEARHGMV